MLNTEQITGGIHIMQDNARKITYGAMMIAMFVILLAITFYVPVLGVVTMYFIPLPIILTRLQHDRFTTILVLVVGTILSLFIGGIFLIPFAMIFGVLGVVIGETMVLKKSKLYTFMASGLSLLILMMTFYVATVFLFNFNMIDVMMTTLQDAQEIMTAKMVQFGELPENFNKQMDDMITFYKTTLPSILILGAFSMAFIFVVLNSMIVGRLGHKVLKFPPFRDMKLPVLTVWTYLLILILPYIAEVNQGTMIYLIYENATVILRFMFLIQGISLIFFFINHKKLPNGLAVLTTAFAIILSPITILLGILDIGVNIRKWIAKDEGKAN